MIGFENYVHLHQRNSKAPSPPGGNSTEGGVGGVHKKIIKEQIWTETDTSNKLKEY